MKSHPIFATDASQAQRWQTPPQELPQQDRSAPRIQPFDGLPDDLLLKIVAQLKGGMPSIEFARDVHNFSLVSTRCRVVTTRYGAWDWDHSLADSRAMAVDQQRRKLALVMDAAASKGFSTNFQVDDEPPEQLREIFEQNPEVRVVIANSSSIYLRIGLVTWANKLPIRHLELDAMTAPEKPGGFPFNGYYARLEGVNSLLDALEPHPAVGKITVEVMLTGAGATGQYSHSENYFIATVTDSDIVTSLRLHDFPGIAALIRAVPTARVLKHLDLRHNGIDEDVSKNGKVCARAIVGMIESSKTLKTLDLRGNPIPPAGKQALLAAARETGVALLLD